MHKLLNHKLLGEINYLCSLEWTKVGTKTQYAQNIDKEAKVL